jgi:hypothetical protein
MKPRKRYYSTESGHESGIDIAVRAPDRRVLCTVMGLAGPDAPGGIEEARQTAAMIVGALNAGVKRRRG